MTHFHFKVTLSSKVFCSGARDQGLKIYNIEKELTEGESIWSCVLSPTSNQHQMPAVKMSTFLTPFNFTEPVCQQAAAGLPDGIFSDQKF
jgi:hypothetical protein